MVILRHCIPPHWYDLSLFVLWGQSAVPLFLLIQVFHTYKKDLKQVSFSPSKIWNRIFKPFLITEIIIITVKMIATIIFKTNLNITPLLHGGYGLGHYYPYVYIQMAFLLPLCTSVLKKWSTTKSIIFFIILSQGYELVCCLIDTPTWIYTLLAFRYIFIIPIGYTLATKGLCINKTTITLSIISAAFLLFFRYSSIDLHPLFYQKGWKSCHWMCYIFICYLLLFLIQKGYQKAIKHHISLTFLAKLGQYSYEIFLFQMFYFAIIHRRLMLLVSNIPAPTNATDALGIIIAITLCTIPVVWYKMRIRR